MSSKQYRVLGLIGVFASMTGGREFASAQYPNAKLLVEPRKLADKLDAYVVLDVRSAEAYAAGHVPNAIRIEHDEWAKTFGRGNQTEEWSRRIGLLGIDGGKPIVVYDDDSGRSAARIWWILRYWGVGDVTLLNGFWHGWRAAKLPVATEPAAIKPVTFRAKPQKNMLATKPALLDALKAQGPKPQIVDARSLAEHKGALLLKNKRGGHLPGAKHLDWNDLIDKKTQRFKPDDELRLIFKDLSLDVTKPCVTYCQSGGRAAVMAFAIELMGGSQVANYYSSWQEWSEDAAAPIAK